MEELRELKILVSKIDDLKRYKEDDDILNLALCYAISEINKRRGYTGEGYETKYHMNALQGAVDWLGRLGGNEYTSFSENGVSATYNEIPSWLASVTPPAYFL